jgi:hypothetical protein
MKESGSYPYITLDVGNILRVFRLGITFVIFNFLRDTDDRSATDARLERRNTLLNTRRT